MERRLAAILSADVEGYSRLVEDDDEATVRTLTRYRDLMRESIEAHHGRVVDAPGDNLLAEFRSVVDAVRCAVELQKALHIRNGEVAPDRRMAFRMGINVGDVVVEGERLYGDGVNIAARLESLADAGGICVSGSAHEQIGRKIDVEFEFVGEQSIKNITKPVSVWRVRMDRGCAADAAPNVNGKSSDPRSVPGRAVKRRPARVLVLAAVSIGIVVTAGTLLWPRSLPIEPVGQSRSGELSSVSASTERPAIIVLPFANLSDDPGQEYFSDGITEDITTDLSKLDALFVVSGRAAGSYKGKAVEPAALREEFGIRYLLEGSVRKAGDQVRISARLIDVVEDRHLWAERYDRSLTDIFALQDDIGSKILTALRVNLTDEERRRFQQAPTTNLEAYDFYLRAQEMTQRARRELRPELMEDAAALYEQAIDLDPEYAVAYGAFGLNRWLTWFYGWNPDSDASQERALVLYEHALALDPNNPLVLRWLVAVRLNKRHFDLALAAAKHLVETFPKDPTSYHLAANVQVCSGQFEDAVKSIERALELFPRLPPWAYWTLGVAYSFSGRLGEAIENLQQATLRSPNYLTNRVVLTVLYWNSGKEDEARAQTREILRISPEFRAGNIQKMLPFKDAAIAKNYIAALRNAGLP